MHQLVTRIVYALTGIFFLGTGLSLLLYRSGWLPEAVMRAMPLSASQPEALHVFQEFGALMLAFAAISFWMIRDFANRMPFHFAMTLFWAIMAGLHWQGWFNSDASPLYPVLNSIPLGAYLLTLKMQRH